LGIGKNEKQVNLTIGRYIGIKQVFMQAPSLAEEARDAMPLNGVFELFFGYGESC